MGDITVKVKEDMTGWVMSEHGYPESRLTVIEQVEDYISPQGQYVAQWKCECSCDKHSIIIVRGCYLKSGHTLSCGCLREEKTHQRMKKFNDYDLSGEYGIGWTSNTNKEFYFDLEDYDKIKNYCWYEDASSERYHGLRAWNKELNMHVRFHYMLGRKYYDHINHNPLDNRKENLRPASHMENMRNSLIGKNNKSGFIGVSWDKNIKKWIVHIRIDGKAKYLGAFVEIEDAAKVRLQAESQYYGEFAPQKHLFKEYNIV